MANRKRTPQPRSRPPRTPPPRRDGRAASTARNVGRVLRAAGNALRRSAFAMLALAIVGYAVYSGLHANDAQDAPAPVPAAPPPPPATTDRKPSRPEPVAQVFAHACGTCHTLKAAGATAGIGPNLDGVKGLTAERVRDQIRTGSLDSAMPRGLLLGADADRVARFVARNAGRRRR